MIFRKLQYTTDTKRLIAEAWIAFAATENAVVEDDGSTNRTPEDVAARADLITAEFVYRFCRGDMIEEHENEPRIMDKKPEAEVKPPADDWPSADVVKAVREAQVKALIDRSVVMKDHVEGWSVKPPAEEKPAAAPEAAEKRLTWDELAKLEPKLLELKAAIKKVSAKLSRQDSRCANEAWYGYGSFEGKGFKAEFLPLVGWERPGDEGDPLRTSYAYCTAMDHLYDLLPDCAECTCMEPRYGHPKNSKGIK